MTYLLPPDGRENQLFESDAIYKSTQSYPDAAGLRVPSQAELVLRYQKNGHVTRASVFPEKPSPDFIYIYATIELLPSDNLLKIHKVWNMSGTGGNKRGVLLTKATFDDGRCYAPTGTALSEQRQQAFAADPGQGANRWCRVQVQISPATSGRVTSLILLPSSACPDLAFTSKQRIRRPISETIRLNCRSFL